MWLVAWLATLVEAHHSRPEVQGANAALLAAVDIQVAAGRLLQLAALDGQREVEHSNALHDSVAACAAADVSEAKQHSSLQSASAHQFGVPAHLPSLSPTAM